MNLTLIFFNETARLRSGWRFGIFIAAFVFAVLVLAPVGVLLTNVLSPEGSRGTTESFLINSLIMLAPALVTGWLCGKILEGLPFRALGAWFTRGWLKHLLIGIVVGTGTLCLAVLLAFIFGGLTFSTNPADGKLLAAALATSFVVFAAGAAWEEALFRGYILQTFARSRLAWVGIGITSLFFGVIHTQNPNATIISTMNTVLAGVWFGIAYLKTRDLWFVWGVHLMWNWMQGAFFGIEVSGITDLVSSPLLKEIDAGPRWLTGESYGIEGGIVTTVALVVSTIAIWYMPWLKPSEEMETLSGRGEVVTR